MEIINCLTQFYLGLFGHRTHAFKVSEKAAVTHSRVIIPSGTLSATSVRVSYHDKNICSQGYQII